MSGGCYPTIFLLSSTIFGSNMFNSGLLNYELKHMNTTKIIGTICLQNIPQIFIQCIYAATISTITPSIAFAFIASVLSIICTPFTFIKINYTSFKYSLEIKMVNDTQIDDDHDQFIFHENENKNFVSHKGKTSKMSKILCEKFGCSSDCIEISRNSTVNTSSITLYVLHCINHIYDHDEIGREIMKLYMQNKNSLKKDFQKHFDLNRECILTFKSLYGKYEIEMVNMENTNFNDFDGLLKKLMKEKGLNYNVMKDKHKLLTSNGNVVSDVETGEQNSTYDDSTELSIKHNIMINKEIIMKQKVYVNEDVSVEDDSESTSDFSFAL